ncbi:MAG: WHG domain-containing protein, partial [Alphaproteobacteria bacterium]
MNADTLEALLGACGASAGEDDPEPTLHRLAQAYVDFVAARPLLWRAVVEHAPPEGRQRPPRHRAAVAALLGLAETALAPLTGPPPAGRARHHARVLWAGLDGIVSLATSGNLAADETPEAQVELTYNWDPETYSGGRNFGHLAFEVEDIYATCQSLMDKSVTINRPPRD